MRTRIRNTRYKMQALIIGLALVALNYGIFVARVGPMLDDWNHLGLTVSGSLRLINANDRPLSHTLEVLTYLIFGHNFAGYLLIQIIVVMASAILFYALLSQILPRERILNLVIAILFFISPLVSNHLWLAAIAYPQALLLLFIAFWLDVKWGKGDLPAWMTLTGAGLFYLLSLLSNESHAALIVAIPFLLFYVVDNNKSILWRLKRGLIGLLPFVFSGVLWLTYRLYLVDFFGFDNPKGANIQIPEWNKFLLESIWPMVGILMTTFWVLPAKIWMGVQSNAPLIISMATLSGIGLALAFWAVQAQEKGQIKPDSHSGQIFSKIPFGIVLTVAGLSLVFLGYFPLLFANHAAYELPLSDGSRTSYAMTPGWAITVAGTGWWLSHRMGYWKNPQRLFLIFSVVVVSVCSAFVVSSSLDYVERWEIQRRVLHNLRELAPGFADDTYVLLTGEPGVLRSLATSVPILQPFEKRGNGVYVFGSSWEVRGILHVLYQNQTLAGDVLKREFVKEGEDNGRFEANGYVPAQIEVDTPSIVPYERLLVVQYDRQGCVRLVLDGMQIREGTIPVGALKASPSRIILSNGKVSLADQILGTFLEQPCRFQ